MIHPARPWTLILSLLITSFHALHPMDNDKPPEKTPLSDHLENFKSKKTKKAVPERPLEVQKEKSPLAKHLKEFKEGKTKKPVPPVHEPAASEEEHALTKHLTQFKQGTIRKLPGRIEQAAPVEIPPLAAHTRQFFDPITCRRQHVQREAPPLEKTEIEKVHAAIALRKAVVNNNKPLVQELLWQGVDPNAVLGSHKQSTLHLAATLGHHEVLEILLDEPLIVTDESDQSQRSPLFYAITNRRPHCMGHLLEHRAWVGPDRDNFTALHLAVQEDDMFSILTFLTYCIDPIKVIPEPSPALIPLQNDQDVFEVLDQIIATLKSHDEEDVIAYPSLRTQCMQKIIRLHLAAQKLVRCDVLSTIWGRPLAYHLPSDIGLDFAQHMDFARARIFVLSFSPHDHEKIAKTLAYHYAKEHIKNLNRLLGTVTVEGQTPLQMAILHNRSPYIQGLVTPLHYATHLNVILKSIPNLKPFLSENPEEQDPFFLFYYLFVYRLLGGKVIFNNE